MEESKEGDEKQGDKGDGKQGEKGDEKQDEPETHEEERVKAVVILPSKSPTRVRGAPPLPPSKSSKPVWSMGPDEAVAKERASKEAAEEEEEQGLLAFVNDLVSDWMWIGVIGVIRYICVYIISCIYMTQMYVYDIYMC